MNKPLFYLLSVIIILSALAFGYHLSVSYASETGPCGAKYTAYKNAADAVQDALKAQNTAYRTYLLSPPLPWPPGWASALSAYVDAVQHTNRKLKDLKAAKKAYDDCKKSHESPSQQNESNGQYSDDYAADGSDHQQPPTPTPPDQDSGPNTDDEDGSPNTQDVDGAPNTNDGDGSPNTNDGDGSPNTNDDDGSPNTNDDDGSPNTEDEDEEEDEHSSANIPLPPPPF